MLIVALAGCTTQKSVNKSVDAILSEAGYNEVLMALDKAEFVIDIVDFYIPSEETKHAVDSYVSMQGKRGVIRFSKNVFPQDVFENLNIVDIDAQIKQEGINKGGDMQYSLKIHGERLWQKKIC